LLLVAFDEAGGTYDHVAPPVAPPPHAGAAPGQMGFTFDRSGQRVPAIAISAWIPERRVVTDEYRHTSLIRTLRERWSLGPPLTARDAIAADIAPILSLDAPRPPEKWPDVTPQPVPPFNTALLPPNLPLSVLGKGIFFGILAFQKSLGAKVPDIPKDTDITGAQAHDILRNMSLEIFPGLKYTG
jgi:phospholipase C